MYPLLTDNCYFIFRAGFEGFLLGVECFSSLKISTFLKSISQNYVIILINFIFIRIFDKWSNYNHQRTSTKFYRSIKKIIPNNSYRYMGFQNDKRKTLIGLLSLLRNVFLERYMKIEN